MALCFTYRPQLRPLPQVQPQPQLQPLPQVQPQTRPQLSADRPLALVPPKVAHAAPIPLATRAGAAARRPAARPSCVDLLTAF